VRPRLFWTLLGIALLMGTGPIACSDGATEEGAFTPSKTMPSAATPVPGPPPSNAGLPDTSGSELEAEQAEAAENLAFANEQLIALLDGVEYEHVATAPWFLKDELVGATVLLSLDPPLAIDQELPSIDIGVRGEEGNETRIDIPYPGYIRITEHYEIEARTIHVFVDLREGKVVEIFPVPFPVDPSDIRFE
jgi:hypothetical protein